MTLETIAHFRSLWHGVNLSPYSRAEKIAMVRASWRHYMTPEPGPIKRDLVPAWRVKDPEHRTASAPIARDLADLEERYGATLEVRL